MKIILYGATGMVGQGVLRECLVADDVTGVLVMGRKPTGKIHPKLHEKTASNIANLAGFENFVSEAKACFFCLGVSSIGMSEADYTKITYDLTMEIADRIKAINPSISFLYVSGSGT